jgi:hypothetical protein
VALNTITLTPSNNGKKVSLKIPRVNQKPQEELEDTKW